LAELGIKVSTVSRPFVVSAVISVFLGSIVGSVWMMSLLGVDIGFLRGALPLHRTLQVDGFLTLIIMGVGYMIVPRFRNMPLPSTKMAHFSLALILFSIAVSIASATVDSTLALLGSAARFSGVVIFAGMVLWMLRVRPRLLRLADYFIALSVISLVAASALDVAGLAGSSIGEIQMRLLFPIFMIFGVEFKTMPSFIGFIRPAKVLSRVSLALAAASVALGVATVAYQELSAAFGIAMLACAATFAGALYTFGGFDNSEIKKLLYGEKKARYFYTVRHSRLAFLFLYAGIALAIAFGFSPSYILYDLAIHYVAIGFIGITVALYLPLMLPPITGKAVHFTKFNGAPVLLVVAALAVRTAGDIVITIQALTPASYFLMTSGWLVVAALFAFVAMIHRSMREAPAGPIA
jgi:hypothetical protein